METALPASKSWKMPAWRRILYGFIALVFVIACAGALLFPEVRADLLVSLIALAGLLFFGWILSVLVIAPSTALIADREGLIPMTVSKKFRRKIFWSEIERMEVVTQKVQGRTFKMIALYLSTDENFGVLAGGAALQGIAGSTMSDGGIANIYIPAPRLNESIEAVLAQLNRFKAGTV